MPVLLKPGWLYFLRDRDYRTGEVGRYVKIGLTYFDRPVIERIDDHQTGNPREVFSLRELEVGAASATENYLHNVWAPLRISGEWFEMSDDQVDEAVDQAVSLNMLIESHRSEIESGKSIGVQTSNGKVKEASEEDVILLEEWREAKEAHVIAIGRRSLFQERLRKMMGKCRGVEGVVEFQDKLRRSSIDKKSIIASHSELLKGYLITKKSISGSLKPEFKSPSLSSLDEELDSAIKEEKEGQVKGTDPLSFESEPAPRSPDIEEAHMGYLESMGEERTQKIRLELATHRAKASCGLFDGIEGVCMWKRVENESEEPDWKRFEEENPEIVEGNMTPEKGIAAFKVKPYRPY